MSTGDLASAMPGLVGTALISEYSVILSGSQSALPLVLNSIARGVGNVVNDVCIHVYRPREHNCSINFACSHDSISKPDYAG